VADVRAVERGAVGEDDGNAAFDAVDENRGGQVIEAWASFASGWSTCRV